MARVAKTTKTAKPAAGRRSTGRAATAAKPVSKPARAAKGGATASRRVPAASAAAPALSKVELRLQVEKLERANATLRAKGREAARASRDTEGRIAELEIQVARLEEAVAVLSRPAQGADDRPPRRRRHREIDPGDAVPPGVAVEEPAPLDEEAVTALENLEGHLGGESPG